MPEPNVGMVLAFGIFACGVVVYLFYTAIYLSVTNFAEARIANVENDETIVSWDDIENAKIHVRALRHELRINQHSLVFAAHENGFPPILVGCLLAIWFLLQT